MCELSLSLLLTELKRSSDFMVLSTGWNSMKGNESSYKHSIENIIVSSLKTNATFVICVCECVCMCICQSV